MEFQIQRKDGAREVVALVEPALVMAGYTGRNRELVAAHIEEMSRHGIPAPASVPTYYGVAWQLLTFSEGRVEVGGAETSGEVEPVLLVTERGMFVTVGSDHTDRAAERESIPRSKRLAPKVVAREAWRVEEVAGHWDKLVMKSWVEEEVVYQEGAMERIMALKDFPVGKLRPRGRDLVLFLGTLPLLQGKFVMAGRFRGEMADPVLGRAIGFSYRVEQLPGGDLAHANG